jgi:DNA-binding transcriptional ArsR family regulator
MAKEETTGQIRGKHARRLPIELAAQLAPPVEHALNHPLRREILRSLNQSEGPRSAGEIATGSLPKTGVTLINYHATVLETCEVVRVAETESNGESHARRYASNVAGDPQIAAILGATEPLDNLGG